MSHRFGRVNLRELLTNPGELLGENRGSSRYSKDSGVALDSSQASSQFPLSQQLDWPADSQNSRSCQDSCQLSQSPRSQASGRHVSSTPQLQSRRQQMHSSHLLPSPQQLEQYKAMALEFDRRDQLSGIATSIKDMSVEMKAALMSLKDAVQVNTTSAEATVAQLHNKFDGLSETLDVKQQELTSALSAHDHWHAEKTELITQLAQKSEQLSSAEVKLTKLSESRDDRDHVLAELERLSVDHGKQSMAHCDRLTGAIQQSIEQLVTLTRQCHGDAVEQMKTAVDQLLQQTLSSINNICVRRGELEESLCERLDNMLSRQLQHHSQQLQQQTSAALHQHLCRMSEQRQEQTVELVNSQRQQLNDLLRRYITELESFITDQLREQLLDENEKLISAMTELCIDKSSTQDQPTDLSTPSRMSAEDGGRNSVDVEDSQTGSSGAAHCIKPRRSVAVVYTGASNVAQAEDLSRKGRRQVEEPWWATDNSRGYTASCQLGNMNTSGNARSMSCFIDKELSEPVQSPDWNVEYIRRSEGGQSSTTRNPRAWIHDSGRSSSSTGVIHGRNLRGADVGNKSLSVIQAAQRRVVGDTSSRSSTANATPVNWNTRVQQTSQLSNWQSTQSCEGQAAQVVPAGGLASAGRPPTVFVPPSVPSSQSQAAASLSSTVDRCLLPARSSYMFARTPVLQGCRGLWPMTPGKALCEPSPVATVMPQVQSVTHKPTQQPQHLVPAQSARAAVADQVENLAPAAVSQTQNRKRRRRAPFGSRRKKKSTLSSHPDVPVASSPTAQPCVTRSVGEQSAGMRDPLKSVENHQLESVRMNTSSGKNPSGRELTAAAARCIKPISVTDGGQSSPGVQQVPSCERDVFDYCSEDNDDWLTTTSVRSATSSQRGYTWSYKPQSALVRRHKLTRTAGSNSTCAALVRRRQLLKGGAVDDGDGDAGESSESSSISVNDLVALCRR